ncbi:MAG: GTP-binding protein [Ectothiorhodospiraceae bacterium]|nr:GTP-binding protein [Ectothiorhodospiraceae bacterium]MCH8506275.1 GTP-binding protein [Ectothiorhodospiraceae bacterium]
MAAPIATTVLCGFLGSGKTTRINALIRAGTLRNALFLVNDFGSIAIDAELIQAEEDSVLRLNNGCACCGVSGNLSAQLSAIRRWKTPPQRLVFEASGIARPLPLKQLFAAASGYQLEAVESLVDASAFQRNLADTAVADIVEDQIRQVALLRVNRWQWLAEAERRGFMDDLLRRNPDARIVLQEDQLAPGTLVAVGQPHVESGPVVSRSLRFDFPVDVERVERLLLEAGPVLLRAKGMLEAAPPERGRYLLQLAGGRLSSVPTSAGRSSALVLIGRQGAAFDRLVEALEQSRH